jgi:outer membrane protein OmpA-like peptidoglycan-associated protein
LNDAVIGEVGVTNHTWKLGVAYDQSANSTLNSIGRNANAWEFYVGFRIPDKTPVIEPPVELPEPETIEPLTYQIRWKISSNDTSELDSLHFMVNDENIFEFNQPNDTFTTPWLVFSGCDSIRIRITGSGFAYYKDTIYTPCPLHHSDSVVINVLMTPLKKNTIIRLENIYFSFDSDTLLPESKEELNELVRLLDDNPSIAIEISAHTDSVGNAPYNLDLSQRRAERCVNFLVERGIEKGRLVARGYGESKPVARNTHPDGTDNPEGRAQNRRVEFIILKGRE